MKQNWENKPLHGKYPLQTQKDQSLFTRNYQAKIIKNGAHPKCWFSVDNLVSGCPIMTPNEYLQKHDRVGQHIHWKICQHYNAPYAKNISHIKYKHKPHKVVET